MLGQVAWGRACVKRSKGRGSEGRGLPQVRPRAPVSLKQVPPQKGSVKLLKREGGPRAPGEAPRFELLVADCPPAPRPGMRSLSLAWLLGGTILLAASVSCNQTQNFAAGELERQKTALGWWGTRGRRAHPRAFLRTLGSFDGGP